MKTALNRPLDSPCCVLQTCRHEIGRESDGSFEGSMNVYYGETAFAFLAGRSAGTRDKGQGTAGAAHQAQPEIEVIVDHVERGGCTGLSIVLPD